MPGAEGKLFLAKAEATLVPRIGDTTVRLPPDREAHIKAAYGDRAKVVTLDDLLKAKRPSLDQKVSLLVVRNKDIDQAGEMMQGFELGLMQKAIEKVLRALRVVQELEFRKAVLATDHGFLFLGEELPGDKILKPEGKWLLEKGTMSHRNRDRGPGDRSIHQERPERPRRLRGHCGSGDLGNLPDRLHLYAQWPFPARVRASRRHH